MTQELRTQRDELVSASDLIDSRRRFIEAVLSSASAGIIGVDASGSIGILNRSAEKLIGHAESETLDHPLSDVLPELDDMMKTARDGTQRLVQGQITITRDGQERNLSVRVSAEQTSQSRDSYIITLDDITELVSAQRTSAWADVARRIAHEIKNPLTPIQLSAERIRRKFGKVITEDKAIFEQCTDTIVRQVDDIRRMVDEFSRFARMPKPVMEGEDVADTVRQAVFLMRVGHPDIDIEAEIKQDPMRGAVRPPADLAGADQHHQERHRGDRAVPPEELGKGRIDVIAARENDDIVIDVIDNGIGLPKVSRARLLEPYVTTREKGTGLGLAIVGRVLEDHGGRIELNDAADFRPGQRGAWMRLRFAVSGQRPRRKREQPTRTQNSRSTKQNRRLPKPMRRQPRPMMKQKSKPQQATDKTGVTHGHDILIVDDEADIRELVAGILEDEGFSTRTARDSDAALAEIANRRPHLVFLDIWLQGTKLDGLQLLEQIKKDHADLPVVMISGHGNIETAVAAIKRGAYDFIEKPFKADRLMLVATRALETSRLKREVKELKQLAPAASVLTGRSACMNQLRQTIERAAKANSRILIVGPSGVGQGAGGAHAAQRVEPRRGTVRRHQRRRDHAGADGSRAVRRRADQRRAGAQGRRAGRGAWRHAVHRRDRRHAARDPEQDPARAGRSDLPALGGTAKVHVDVRIISSTARNLEEEIAAGRFREDLYHRLSVVPIRVPPLSERREDIPELIDYFMEQISAATGLAEAPDRPGRDGGAAVARLARQRPPAPQQRRARDDSGRRRSGGDHHRRHAAAGRRLDGAGDADQQQWRAHHGPAAARGAGGVRARLSDRADQPLLRQHLAHSGIRRHGALGAASQAQGARGRLSLMNRCSYARSRSLPRADPCTCLRIFISFRALTENGHRVPTGVTRELACLKTAPAL